MQSVKKTTCCYHVFLNFLFCALTNLPGFAGLEKVKSAKKEDGYQIGECSLRGT